MVDRLLPLKNLDDIIDLHKFLRAIWKEFFVYTETIIEKRKDLSDPIIFYKKHNGNFWILRKDNNIIATIAIHEIQFENEKVGFLRRFFIDKNYRGQGFGSIILKFIENYCKNKTWSYIIFGVCESMERNLSFYMKKGYKEFYNNVPQELLDDNDKYYLRKKIKKGKNVLKL